MTPHQIVALALRLFAIWLGIHALTYVPWLFQVSGAHSPDYVYVAFMLGVNVVIILVLWFLPRIIAWKVLPSAELRSGASATADTWLAMGCTLIGLSTLTTYVPRVIRDLFEVNSLSWAHDADAIVWVLSDVLGLAIAVWLVLGGKGVGKIFRWAQYAGIKKDL
jgi:hypothetical protein